MNAIVGLCHFCEAHGPRPLFCTFTTDNDKNTTESSRASVQCSGCTSLGPETVFVSREDDGTIYCSRESVPNADVTSFLRQAAIRSITCEVNWNKEGGVVYFNDTHGHVLTLTFQVKDTWARGLKRWFSIVVLMKDKMLLLNITPLLSEHMQKISKELQDLAEVVFDAEQKVCSQRALRLKTGRNDFVQSRSLMHLTDNLVLLLSMRIQFPDQCYYFHLEFLSVSQESGFKLSYWQLLTLGCVYRCTSRGKYRSDLCHVSSRDDNVFKRLHSHFTWMLKAGAHTYSETLYTSQDLLKKLQPHAVKKSIFEPGTCSATTDKDCVSLRVLEKLLSKALFRILMYCTLTGVYIVINSSNIEAGIIINGLCRLLPINITDNARIRQARIEDQIPPTVCFLEETENSNYCLQWAGSLPAKCPTLMNRIENSMNNDKFNDDVLHQHVKSLQLEWLGISKAVKAAIDSSGSRSDAVAKLKQVFGVAQHDELLLNYWMSAFCS